MKIKFILPIIILAMNTFNLQASKKMTTKKAKAYSSDLELYGKTLNEIEGIITKKHVGKEKLQSAIEKLKSQEKKLIAYRDGKSFFDHFHYKKNFYIEIRDQQYNSKTDPMPLLYLGSLPSFLEQIVEGTYLKEGEPMLDGSRRMSRRNLT